MAAGPLLAPAWLAGGCARPDHGERDDPNFVGGVQSVLQPACSSEGFMGLPSRAARSLLSSWAPATHALQLAAGSGAFPQASGPQHFQSRLVQPCRGVQAPGVASRAATQARSAGGKRREAAQRLGQTLLRMTSSDAVPSAEVASKSLWVSAGGESRAGSHGLETPRPFGPLPC